MADRESLGPIQLAEPSLVAINDAFRQVVDRIDELKGLRGRTQLHDRVGVSDPEVASDAVTLGTSESGFVTVATEQTILGAKTIQGVALRFTDASGNLVHAFGAIV